MKTKIEEPKVVHFPLRDINEGHPFVLRNDDGSISYQIYFRLKYVESDDDYIYCLSLDRWNIEKLHVDMKVYPLEITEMSARLLTSKGKL